MSNTNTAIAAIAATPAGALDEVIWQLHSIGNCPPGLCRFRLPTMPRDNYIQEGEHNDPAREMRAAGPPPAAHLGPVGLHGDALPQACRAGFDSRLVHHRRGSGDRSPNVPAGKAAEQATIVQYNVAITGLSALTSQISPFHTHYPTPGRRQPPAPRGLGDGALPATATLTLGVIRNRS